MLSFRQFHEETLDEKCWDTHTQEGMKKKGGKWVPNCVPKSGMTSEAANRAQQAAIAIAMKKAGKKPKGVAEETIDEDWQKVNKSDRTDGLSQKAVNAYRRENPGSKLQTAVTEKNPKGKRAARRKSFCSRMSGMKKRLTSSKNARDPDSPINKALRRWNC